MSHILRGSSRTSSDTMSRILTDTNYLMRGYDAILGRALEWIFKAVVALVAAAFLKFSLTVFAIAGAVVALIIYRKLGKRLRRAATTAMVETAEVFKAMSESLRGIEVVKVHNAEGYERRRVARRMRRVYEQQRTAARIRAISSPLMEALGLVAAGAAAVVAAYYIIHEGLKPEVFMTVIAMLGASAGSLKPLSNLNNMLHEATAGAERVLSTMQTRSENEWETAGAKGKVLARHRKSIRFEDVSFSYPNSNEFAVDHIDLEAKHGETVAIVGPNGSGKSTLLNLLPRLSLPDTGRILVDGVDIADVSLRSLRKQIAVVTQKTILFGGTIAENIAYARLNAKRERIIEAAKAAFVDEFVDDLPNGYDTLLSEDGVGLSGGQKQRICIARAMLRDPAILILDEATSQIDADSEAKINDALKTFQEGRTTFVIAHRLSTVIDADKIVVMNRGKIEAVGKHVELLESSATYRTLTQTQLQHA